MTPIATTETRYVIEREGKYIHYNLEDVKTLTSLEEASLYVPEHLEFAHELTLETPGSRVRRVTVTTVYSIENDEANNEN
jgi:hypothetical protein